MDNKESEYQRVEAEVQKRRQRAEELGIKDFMGKLFRDIRNYPTWFKNDRKYTPLITDAKELEPEEREGDNWRKWQITLNGSNYIFAFRENSFCTPDGEYHRHGKLELYKDGKKLLILNLSYDIEEYSDMGEWSAFGIDGFIEGNWIKDFKELYEASEKMHEEIRKNLFRKPINKLKEDFDIE